jgi:hypothetical protein
MKTIYLLICILYLLPTILCLLRLIFDKETVSIKKFMFYGYWAFVPIFNLIMVWFMILEFRDNFKAWIDGK